MKPLVALAFALALVGCFGKRLNSEDSQVVATVNGQEITVSQLNQALQSTDPGPANGEGTKRAIDSLVSEELLVQGALKHQLDRDPGVVMAIEAARRQVLARYFAERNLYPKKTVSNGEIEDFYKSAPVLFENRKRFQIKTYSVSSVDVSDRLKVELDQVHSAADLRDLLDKHEMKYSTQTTSVPADQLPFDKLPEFARAKAGDIMIATQNSGKTSLMYIVAVEDDNPMPFDRAKPYIEVYLANLRNGRAVADYLEQARSVAKIAYPPNIRGIDSRSSAPPGNSTDDRVVRDPAGDNETPTHAVQ